MKDILYEEKELKNFISDWSDKKVNGLLFDEVFKIGQMPLSWYYRPILYSDLLPSPFVTTRNYFKKNKWNNKIKIKSFNLLFKKAILILDYLREITCIKKKTSKNEKVLFLTFSKGSFREKKIIELIRKDKKIEPFVLGVYPQTSMKIKDGFNHSLYEYYDKKNTKKAKAKSFDLYKKWKKLDEKNKQKMFFNKGDDMYRYYKENLNFLYSKEFIYCIYKYYYTFKRIIKKENIKAIVLSSQNNIFEKCLISAAYKEDIPVFIIQHGIALGTLTTVEVPRNVFYAVFSQKYKEDLMKLGINKNKIKITGPIILDGVEKFKSNIKNNRMILFATSPIVEDRYMVKKIYFKKLKKVLLELKEVSPNIILKLHPREKNKNNYLKIMSEVGIPIENLIYVSERDKHYSLIKGCDLLVSYGSTVALEAMIIGRPTLSIDLFDKFNPANDVVRESNSTTKISYNQNITEIANKLINGEIKKEPKLIEELCYKTDGKASERVVNLIYNSIK